MYRASCIMIFFLVCSLFTASDAKVYIDITAPAFRKLPLSISHTGPDEAKEVAEIVKNDLDFTGIFHLTDPDILGAEITVKIDAAVSEIIKTDVLVFDLIKNEEILSKRYTASKSILRALSHSISNDIFKVITGKDGIFRTRLAYTVNSSDKKGLYIMDWDGYNPVRVVAKGLTLSQSWSHDSQYLVYSSERDRNWGIYSLDLEKYKETMLFSGKSLNLVGGISPNGLIAFSSSKDGSPEIYVMNIDGSNHRKLIKSFGIDVSPVFSPDGSQIAFVSDRGGSPQIYIMDADGARLRRLTFEGSYNTSPMWSPDGKWIVFVGRKDGNNHIFMIKFDGSDLRQLTEKGNNENPTLSPDGMFIAFDSDRDGSKGIYLMSINGERQKRITPKDIKAMNPKWSPYHI
ncbi:MAG: PD40 domain-containing protein [Nitrospirae bacterium]|nr:PD40 domain-containing protein [Nitrospirota bacterium]